MQARADFQTEYAPSYKHKETTKEECLPKSLTDHRHRVTYEVQRMGTLPLVPYGKPNPQIDQSC